MLPKLREMQKQKQPALMQSFKKRSSCHNNISVAFANKNKQFHLLVISVLS